MYTILSNNNLGMGAVHEHDVHCNFLGFFALLSLAHQAWAEIGEAHVT